MTPHNGRIPNESLSSRPVSSLVRPAVDRGRVGVLRAAARCVRGSAVTPKLSVGQQGDSSTDKIDTALHFDTTKAPRWLLVGPSVAE